MTEQPRRPPPLAVWDEYGSAPAEALGSQEGAQAAGPRQTAPQSQAPGRLSGPAPAPGSPAAQAWLTALAEHCESSAGAAAKAALGELLRCGARSRDKVVTVTNRARQAIALVFRRGRSAGEAEPGSCCSS